MAQPSTEVSRQEVEAAFALCGDAPAGMLKITDLKLVMRGLGFDPRNAQIEAMTKKIKETKATTVMGEQNPNHIDVDEFLSLLKDSSESDKSLEEMRGAFRLFDKEGKGFITAENLRQVAKELGETLEMDELEEMIAEAARTGDGRVTEDAFFDVMKKTCLY